MKTKSVFSRLSIVLLAAVAVTMSGCSMNFQMTDGYMFTFKGETAESTEDGKFSDGITSIDVVNKFGNVKVKLAAGEPGWKWDSKVWADSQELADQLIDEMAMNVQTDGQKQTWNIVLPEPTSDLNGVESNLTLMVPADVNVKLVNSHGDVSAAKISADVELENQHGNVDLSDLKGMLDAKNSHGNLKASQIGESKIKVSHGNADVLDATGNVNIENSHGIVVAKEIVGEVSIDGSHSNIKVDQVSSAGKIKTSHGEINATNLNGDVKASNSHGSIRISTSGDNVSISASHGQIDLTMVSSSFNSIDLETSHDSIKIRLPENANPAIDMKATHGDTKSEFESAEGSPQKVKLRTSHGNIRVSKSEAAVGPVQ